jgi:hypothetical protein
MPWPAAVLSTPRPVDDERAVLSGRANATAKTGDGPVEMLRMFRLARTSAVKDHTQAINRRAGRVRGLDGLVLKGRDRAEEIQEVRMRPTHVGRLEPSINDVDPEFHTGRGGYGDPLYNAKYAAPGTGRLPGAPVSPVADPPDSETPEFT